MEIPIPHYPPYSSKYNPIRHRFFLIFLPSVRG
ncbi:ISAzo13-like element transposase-related protein [Trichormus azollae]